MTITLHFGVVDVPYDNRQGMSVQEIFDALRAGKPPSRSKVKGVVSTGDVATFLENKYHVMETFYEHHQADVAAAMENSLAGALESLLQGGPVSAPAYAGATSAIETQFRKFLESKEMDTLGIPGVPTRASLEGINHRKASKEGGPRPSFIDTGLYENNFTAWVD